MFGMTPPPNRSKPHKQTPNRYTLLIHFTGNPHKKAPIENIIQKRIECLPSYPFAHLSTINPPSKIPRIGPVKQITTKTTSTCFGSPPKTLME